MAKPMARIENGAVVNLEWCSDYQAQDGTMVDVQDRPVRIGDSFDGVSFYRDGIRVLSATEEALGKIKTLEAKIDALTSQNEFLEECVAEMAGEVYA